MDNRTLTNAMEQPIKIAFDDRHNTEALLRKIKEYIDANNTVLYANAPLHRLYFSDAKDREIVFRLSGLKESYVKETIKKTHAIRSAWVALNKPFNILMIMVIRDQLLRKNEAAMKNTLLYLSLSLYSNLHSKYFKYLPNENVMSYTINNLNNKFLFKQYGVVIKAVMHTADKTMEKYQNILRRGNDEDIANFVMYLQTRLNNLMKNFTSEYMKNYQEKNYLNLEKENSNEEDYFEADNVSLTVTRVTSQVTNKFYSSELSEKFIRVASRYCDVSPVTLKDAIHNIKRSKSRNIENLVRSIMQVYLLDGKNSYESIGSQKFIGYCISIYSKSNTRDQNILTIKRLLDEFMKNNSSKYSETEREATKINYRKAFYMYIVLFIQSNQLKK
jgi:hypothetical protein